MHWLQGQVTKLTKGTCLRLRLVWGVLEPELCSNARISPLFSISPSMLNMQQQLLNPCPGLMSSGVFSHNADWMSTAACILTCVISPCSTMARVFGLCATPASASSNHQASAVLLQGPSD